MLVISSSLSRARMATKASARVLPRPHVGQHAARFLGHRVPLEFVDGLRQGIKKRGPRFHQQRQQVEQKTASAV